MDKVIFITIIRSAVGKKASRLMIESLRTFGVELRESPVWVFAVGPESENLPDPGISNVRIIPLDVPDHLLNYEFGGKVYACARAEELAPPDVQSLVWIDPTCLVVNPPVLYTLDGSAEAAVRPVHIRNVGLLMKEPLDPYWKKIYETVGVTDTELSVESFVDRQPIRAYFNTHAFAVDPKKGLLSRWLGCFEQLINHREFQGGPCQDELHRIFLHQAVLSALIAASLQPEQVRILPPEYNYPYHLHKSLSLERRAAALNDLVTFTYEDWPINPAGMDDIQVNESFKSWLLQHL